MKDLNFSELSIAHPEKMICYCKGITQKEIENAIQQGARMLCDIQRITGACTGNQCKELNPSGKCCSGDINLLLKKNDNGLFNPPCCC